MARRTRTEPHTLVVHAALAGFDADWDIEHPETCPTEEGGHVFACDLGLHVADEGLDCLEHPDGRGIQGLQPGRYTIVMYSRPYDNPTFGCGYDDGIMFLEEVRP